MIPNNTKISVNIGKISVANTSKISVANTGKIRLLT